MSLIGKLIKDDSFVSDDGVFNCDMTFVMVDEAMDAFETLVLSQQPASQPWTPVTDYSFEARKAIEGKHPQLIKDVLKPKRVIDAGCGPGHLLDLLRDLDVMCIGLDKHPPKGRSDIVRRDISAKYTVLTGHARGYRLDADLVVCREVLEHLTLLQVRQAIANLCKLSSKYVYITTRFSSEHDLLRVETSDDLDPTHITLPAKDLYRLLLTLEGFKRRADLEEAMDWQHKGRCLVYERA